MQRFRAQPVWVRIVSVALALLVWFLVAGLLVVLVVPLGAVTSALAWLVAFTFVGLGIASSGRTGKLLLSLLWLPKSGAERRRQRVRAASIVLIVVGLVAVFALYRAPGQEAPGAAWGELTANAKPTASSVCFLIPTVFEGSPKLGASLISSLMGHGTVSPLRGPNCRWATLVGPRAFLPLLLAVVLVAGLWARHGELERKEAELADAARRREFTRSREVQGADGVAAGEGGRSRGSMAAVAPAAVPPLSRPAPVAAAVRRTWRDHWSVEMAMAAFHRAPVLAFAASVYLFGWLLLLLGSDAPNTIARQLSPDRLARSFNDWSVLGIWISLLAGVVFGLWVTYLKRRQEA